MFCAVASSPYTRSGTQSWGNADSNQLQLVLEVCEQTEQKPSQQTVRGMQVP